MLRRPHLYGLGVQPYGRAPWSEAHPVVHHLSAAQAHTRKHVGKGSQTLLSLG